MAVGYGQQQGIGADDLLTSPIRVRRRSALQELGDYPFFNDADNGDDAIDEEEERPAVAQSTSWGGRRGGMCLAVLVVTSVVEVVVLGMLLR